MKIFQSSIFRSFVAIIVGILLIEYREDATKWLTIACGALFFISGLISVIFYYSATHHNDDVMMYDAEGNIITSVKPTFPIVGLGSMILGIILAIMPTSFITGLMYVFAAILILGAISQFAALAVAAKYSRIGLFFWLMPSLIMLIGIVAIVRPSTIASAPLFILGWTMLLYGIVEVINAIKIHQANKVRDSALKAQELHQQELQNQQNVPVDPTPQESNTSQVEN